MPLGRVYVPPSCHNVNQLRAKFNDNPDIPFKRIEIKIEQPALAPVKSIPSKAYYYLNIIFQEFCSIFECLIMFWTFKSIFGFLIHFWIFFVSISTFTYYKFQDFEPFLDDFFFFF